MSARSLGGEGMGSDGLVGTGLIGAEENVLELVEGMVAQDC